MENLFKNQGLLWWLIVSLIVMTLIFESTVILYGQIRSQPLVGIEGLRRQGAKAPCNFSKALLQSILIHTNKTQYDTRSAPYAYPVNGCNNIASPLPNVA